MKKVNFTPDFYKQLIEEVRDYCKSNYENEENDPTITMSPCVTVGDYEVECEAEVECELKDDSFDHAFGTWHDPCAGYYYGSVVKIYDVHVYDEDGEVEGFSDDGFVVEEFNGIKSGDQVMLKYSNSQKTYKVVSYDLYEEVYKLTDGEKEIKKWSSHIKKVA